MTASTGKLKPHIRWNQKEWDAVAARVHELARVYPDWTEIEAVRSAQEDVLPRERWKTHKSLAPHDLQNSRYQLAKVRALERASQAAQAPASTPAPSPAPATPPEAATQPQDVPPPLQAPAPPRAPARRPSLLDLITGQIATQVGAAVKEALRQAVADPEVVELFQHAMLDVLTTPGTATVPVPGQEEEGDVGLPTEPEPTPAPAPTPPGVEKPRVMVVGLLGAQANSVSQEFPDMELRFFGAETQHKRLTEQASSADYALVMTKFVTHPAEFAVRRAKPDDFRRVNGGPSDLISVLRSIRVDWRFKHKQEEKAM